MPRWSPQLPEGDLSVPEVALWHLRVALDDKSEEPEREDGELLGQLSLDHVKIYVSSHESRPYFRPWETAARIIELNEYELYGELRPVTDRKIAALRRTQRAQDVLAGYLPEQGIGVDPDKADLLRAGSGAYRSSWGDR